MSFGVFNHMPLLAERNVLGVFNHMPLLAERNY